MGRKESIFFTIVDRTLFDTYSSILRIREVIISKSEMDETESETEISCDYSLPSKCHLYAHCKHLIQTIKIQERDEKLYLSKRKCSVFTLNYFM